MYRERRARQGFSCTFVAAVVLWSGRVLPCGECGVWRPPLPPSPQTSIKGPSFPVAMPGLEGEPDWASWCSRVGPQGPGHSGRGTREQDTEGTPSGSGVRARP